MKTDILTLQELFQKDIRYLIPTFQRPYVWTKENQWEPLWEDVRDTAEQYLETWRDKGESSALHNTPAHFLGAVVIQQESFGVGEIEKQRVIDGQQRLTTLQLLLDAAQEVFEGLGLTPAKRLSKFVLNDKDMVGGDEDHVFKVWPTQMDRNAFRQAMHNLPGADDKGAPIIEAHNFFASQIRAWVTDDSELLDDRAKSLEAAVTRLLNLVVIDLDEDENPHVIFEALNARGTPLLQAELVKNFILQGAGEEEQDIYDRHLQGLETAWWRGDKRQGRLLRPHVDAFLNYWLAMRRAEEVQAHDVFSDFRQYADGQSIVEIAADIERISGIYHKIETTEDDSPLGRFLYRWQVMQIGAITPALLWLLSSGVPERQLERCLRILDSYLTRRMICRMTTKDYNKLFHALPRDLHDGGPSEADNVLRKFLAGQTAPTRIWPTDQDIQEHFVGAPLYRLLTRGRLRLVFEGIEEQLRTTKAEDSQAPKNLTIEHVMPQGWRAHWPAPSSEDDVVEAEAQRDRLVHSIGNLTFVNQKLNSALSNAPWEEKREELDKHSTLFLNKELLEEAGNVWDEAAIKERAKRLAKVAVKVWPHADGI